MPCDTRRKRGQSIKQRAAEVEKIVATLAEKLAAGRAKAIVGKDGGIAFQGLTDTERDDVTDACAYRRIMATGSILAKQAIMRAEQAAGRSVNRQAIAQGLHSHDGGQTWHNGH